MLIGNIAFVVIALAFGFGLVVLIHEFGHFIMARRHGIRVEAFSIGFGKVLYAWRRGETEYRVSLLPLGGYVKMTGEDPDDEAARNDPASFANQSVWARLQVILAGPCMNLVLAAVLMPLVFLIGRDRPVYEAQAPVIEAVKRLSEAERFGLQPGDRIVAIDGTPTKEWKDVQDALLLAGAGTYRLTYRRGAVEQTVVFREGAPLPWGDGYFPLTFLLKTPVIGHVEPDSPAARSGLQPGDVVLAVAGQPIEYWDELAYALSQGRSLWFWLWTMRAWHGDTDAVWKYLRGEPLELYVRRDGEVRPFAVEPSFDTEAQRYVVGIRQDREALWRAVAMERQSYALGPALRLGFQELWRLFGITGTFLQRLVSAPSQHYESLSGPVGIITMFARIAQEGLGPYLFFLAFVSLQLGLLNLLPIPILDGGHVVFLLWEGIVRRPLSVRVRAAAQWAGLCFLLALLSLVTVNDLGRFEGLRRFFSGLFS